MTKELQRITLESEDIAIFDLGPYGYYYGYVDSTHREIPEIIHKCWQPNEDFVKIPADYVMAWNMLCIANLSLDPRVVHHLDGEKEMPKGTRTLEVAADPYRNKLTNEVRLFIPPQVVSTCTVASRSVDLERPPIDLITGEVMSEWWNEWYPYGRFHSHNTMGTTPSGTDNTHELKGPGVCAIFGAYKRDENMPHGHKFEIYPSVVTPYPGKTTNVRRIAIAEPVEGEEWPQVRRMSWTDIMEWDPESAAEPHEDVWNNIFVEEPEDWKESKPKPKGKVLHMGQTGSYRDWDSRWSDSRPASTTKAYDRFNKAVEEALASCRVPERVADSLKWRFRMLANTFDEIMDKSEEYVFDVQFALSAFLWNTLNIDCTFEADYHEDDEPQVIDLSDDDVWDGITDEDKQSLQDFLLEYDMEAMD